MRSVTDDYHRWVEFGELLEDRVIGVAHVAVGIGQWREGVDLLGADAVERGGWSILYP